MCGDYGELPIIGIPMQRVLFENGVAAKTVSELLGHKNVSHTLDVYTHVMPDNKSAAVKALDYIFE